MASVFKKKGRKDFHLRSVDPKRIKSSRISLSEYHKLKGAESDKLDETTPFSKGEVEKNDVKEQHSLLKRKSKYNAKKTVIDDILFDSKLEANRYIILKERLSLGQIKNLSVQKRFLIKINDENICSYVADFYYYCTQRKSCITEDVKGKRLPVYKLKKKLMKAVLGIDIVEIDKDTISQ